MADAAHTARAMWTLFEPIHAVTYFAPEARAAFEEAGLRGFWRGYFAGRAAPLGPAGAAVVTASFFNFAPAFVARAIPAVWDLITPEDALATRLAARGGGPEHPAGRTRGRGGGPPPTCSGWRSVSWTSRAGCWPRPTRRCRCRGFE